jgi:DNA polymerase III sliding clamp (beta) subunit (PCNA family)
VLPFTSKEDVRPVLQCVNFVAKEGKLTLVSADGFRLAIVCLDFDGEGQALISRAELQGIASALKSAKRARVSFESEDIAKVSNLIIDTELIRYKWLSNGGQYPDYEKLIPKDFNCLASFDTVEAAKAVSTLKALSDGKDYPIDLTIGDGKVVMANPDVTGEAELPADTDGIVKVRIQGQYLADVLRACGGMVDFSLADAKSPMLFSQNGYQVVVMPMMTAEADKQAKAEKEAKAEQPTEPEAEPEPVKPKAKKRKAKQPVTAK